MGAFNEGTARSVPLADVDEGHVVGIIQRRRGIWKNLQHIGTQWRRNRGPCGKAPIGGLLQDTAQLGRGAGENCVTGLGGFIPLPGNIKLGVYDETGNLGSVNGASKMYHERKGIFGGEAGGRVYHGDI